MSSPKARDDARRASFLKRSWRLWRSALRGDTEDFTTGPIGTAVFLLSVPMVLEMALESVFAVTDIFFVAQLGADAVAATIGRGCGVA